MAMEIADIFPFSVVMCTPLPIKSPSTQENIMPTLVKMYAKEQSGKRAGE